MNEILIWQLLLFGSIVVNVGLLVYFFFLRHAVIHVFGSWRAFWNKEKGYGYAVIIHPERRIQPVFVKFDDHISVNERSYVRISNDIYQFLGLPAMFYNENDSEPINFSKFDNSNEINHDANYLDSVIMKIKAWAEAKAFKKFEIIFFILIGIAILCVLIAIITGKIAVDFTTLQDNAQNIIYATAPQA